MLVFFLCSPIPISFHGESQVDDIDPNNHCHLRLITPASCLTFCNLFFKIHILLFTKMQQVKYVNVSL